jgi:Flp pilus assembly protein TadG
MRTTHSANRMRRPRVERGTSVIEMSLLLTFILIPLVLGLIEIGRYAAMSIATANAARAGLQYGAQNLVTAADTSGIESAATADVQNIPGFTLGFPNNATAVVCTCSNGGGSCASTPPPCSGTEQEIVYLQVNTTGTFHLLFSRSSVTVNGTAEMRVAE